MSCVWIIEFSVESEAEHSVDVEEYNEEYGHQEKWFTWKETWDEHYLCLLRLYYFIII
jgi:hypothetical protein